jgi:hypothetical protein
MVTRFSITRDINGTNGFGLEFTNTAYSATLTQDTDTTLTIPGGGALGGSKDSSSNYFLAIFSYDPSTSTWVALNTAAHTPAGASFAATASELNPVARLVKGGDVLHFWSHGTATNVSVILYSLS